MIDKLVRIGCRGNFERNTIYTCVHLDIGPAAILHIIIYTYILLLLLLYAVHDTASEVTRRRGVVAEDR